MLLRLPQPSDQPYGMGSSQEECNIGRLYESIATKCRCRYIALENYKLRVGSSSASLPTCSVSDSVCAWEVEESHDYNSPMCRPLCDMVTVVTSVNSHYGIYGASSVEYNACMDVII